MTSGGGRQRSTACAQAAVTELAFAREALAHGRVEMQLVHSLHQNRREVLATELAQARRDLELEVTGTLARAAAQAQDLRDGAAREAWTARAAAEAEVDHLQRRRDELVAEIVELPARLLAVVARLSPANPGADNSG